MVNPNVRRILDADSITIGCLHALADDIAHNNVFLLPYE
jgi:hypothetical protein